MRTLSAKRQAAFTLVELLVVITIIGILAGLISVAAVGAMNAAKNTKIKFEVDQIDAAMKAFKQQYGAYPPCNLVIDTSANPNLPLKAFISRAFPRYNQANLIVDLQTAGVDTTTFNPARALVFWLSGFSPDVTRPFTNADGTAYTGTRVPLYGFDKTRLLNATTGAVADATIQPGNQVYVPAGGDIPTPIVFFDSRVYTTNAANPQPTSPRIWTAAEMPSWMTANSPGTPAPYAHDVNNSGSLTTGTSGDAWANADSIQIISAGQDGKFNTTATGIPKLFPAGTGYQAEDNDNSTNFSSKATIGDDRP